MEDNYLITPNIIRAIKKCKQNTIFMEDLVDPLARSGLNEILNTTQHKDAEFSIKQEFQSTYQIVKANLQSSPEDTQVLNTAQRFLKFMLDNEMKINGINAVKDFKEAVFNILDDEDEKLKDKVIAKFNMLVEV